MYKSKEFKLSVNDLAICVCGDSFTELDDKSRIANRLGSLESIFVNVYFPQLVLDEDDDDDEEWHPNPTVVKKQRMVQAMFSTFATALIAGGTFRSKSSEYECGFQRAEVR